MKNLIHDLNQCYLPLTNTHIKEEDFGHIVKQNPTYSPAYYEADSVLVYTKANYYMLDKLDFLSFRLDTDHDRLYTKVMLDSFNTLDEAIKFVKHAPYEVTQISYYNYLAPDGLPVPLFEVSTFSNNN